MQNGEKLKLIYEIIAPTITRSEETWKTYLRFSSMVYKHSFDSALLVYAQKPKSTMLATFETWTSPKVGRSINKGEKGIAVCEYADANIKVKHLFDVSQTNGENMPKTWALDDEIKAGLLKRLSNSRGIQADSLMDCISHIVTKRLNDNIDKFLQGFENDVKDHFLGDIPHDGLISELTETIYNSCMYFIASRCGETTDTSMPAIAHFDTVPLIQRLGFTVTELSKGILLEIERNVKLLESERSNQNARTTGQQRTPRPNQQLGDRGRTGSASRQVRQDGIKTPARDESPKVFTFDDAGRSYEPDAQGGQGSNGERGSDLPEDVSERPDAENRRHTGTGSPPEQAQGYGGRNRDKRNGADTEITETEREPQGSFSMPVDDEEIIKGDLLNGSMFENSKTRIYNFVKENRNIGEISRFLKNEYGWGGHSGNGNNVFFIDYRSTGIAIGIRDENAENGRREIKLKWNDVAKRISALVESGEYLPDGQSEAEAIKDVSHTPDEDVIAEESENNEVEGHTSADITEEATDSVPDYALLWQRYSALASEYPNQIIFIHAGIFNEVMGESAIAVSDELGLSATNRDVGLAEEVPVIGFSADATDICKNELLKRGYSVVVADAETAVEFTPEPEEAGSQLSLFSLGNQFVPADLSDTDEAIEADEYDDETEIAALEDVEDDILDGSGGIIETPVSEPEVTTTVPQLPPAPMKTNYRYSEDDNLFTGGAKTKFRNNIEAIRLLKTIEAEKRLATPSEQKVLANYVGWGGLSNAFSKTASGWENEYQELKIILDEDEYSAAMESTITAFYTEPKIAEAMLSALNSFGFDSGERRTIVEPALGTGNFFSVLPDSLQSAKIHGIELDSITGRIARQLYQNFDIKIQGFENTGFEDNSVDVILGNIPFNNIKVYDSRYEDENFLIHDYFIAKSLDLLKTGGIMAVITSKGTLDKHDTSAREYFARRADLIGAVRLPNNAFSKLAGTEVTADILFFQKLEQLREGEKSELPEWIFSSRTKPDSLWINEYYHHNPDMILGKMVRDYGMYGNQDGTACIAPEGQDLYADLNVAMGKLSAAFTAEPNAEEITEPTESSNKSDEKEIAADFGTKNYTYVIKDNDIFFCENGYLIKQEYKGVKAKRIKGLCSIRHALLDVIAVQSRDYEYGELEEAQEKLNKAYDAFVSKYSYINDKANSAVFSNDDQYPLLRSIEDLNDDRETYRKSPIFTKATIKSYRQPDHAENAKEALEISLNTRLKVDLEYMAHLYGKPKDEVIEELGDRIFLNPQNFYGNQYEGWETSEEYLSGDVVSKLEYAKLKAENNELFSRNIPALEAVQPVQLLPSDIDFRIGSPWIPLEYYRQFMYELFGTPEYLKPISYGSNNGRIELDYLEYTDTWRISNKSANSSSVKVNQTYGTSRVNGYEIYEDCLNMQSVTVRDPVRYRDSNGKEQTKYVINANETMIARSKQQQIKEAFASWLFADKDRAEILLTLYNERFNRIRPREYDGSHLRFDGMSEERELREHQINVVARIVYHGTCMMAHEVGAGKTAAMIAAGMYMRNMGVIKKPIYVVPNHLIEQWSNEFLRFFPSANILATTETDFKKKNRHKFISKIAMGDYDGVIIGHSQFEKIPVSKARQERLLREEISSLTRIIEQMKAEKGENWAVKQIVIFQKRLKARLESLIKEERKDDLLDFEQLGIDYLFVDEAHKYKNCYTYTKLRNVAGIGQSNAQRASDMLMKCQYLQEINNGRGVTFATGTPISNSMSEMYVMQRFLQPAMLKKAGLHFFDKWAATFGDTISSLEINPEGSGYRIKNRFSKFHNLPELMKMFRTVADIQTSDMLNLPIPELDGGKAKVIVTERSEFQSKIMESFVERAEAIRKRDVDPEDDNMLKLTNEARLMAIDPRLVHPDAPNDPDSKLNTCIRNIHSIWTETSDKKLAQVIFCDSGTPKPGKFNVYDEVKEQLIKMGVPASEIAFVHDANTDAQREAMFEATRKGEIRVLLGSTEKLGTGTNIQTKLCALHHIDVPWRPSDIIQRDGRGLRAGNSNEAIRIFRYVTKDTFDAYLWQIQEQKLRYITQIMTSKSISRSCEDTDETVLTAAEIKAIATSNPLLAEKMTVDNEVTRLKLLKGNWTNERLTLERNIEHYPDFIARSEKRIEGIENDISVLDKHKSKDFIITIDGNSYNERPKAGEVMMTVINSICNAGEGQFKIGNYRGLDVYAERKNFYETDVRLMGEARYSTYASDSPLGNITRIENLAERLPTFLSEEEARLSEARKQLEVARESVKKPFEYEEKLSQHLTRQSEINTKLEFQELSKQQDEILKENADDEMPEIDEEDEAENEYDIAS